MCGCSPCRRGPQPEDAGRRAKAGARVALRQPHSGRRRRRDALLGLYLSIAPPPPSSDSFFEATDPLNTHRAIQSTPPIGISIVRPSGVSPGRESSTGWKQTRGEGLGRSLPPCRAFVFNFPTNAAEGETKRKKRMARIAHRRTVSPFPHCAERCCCPAGLWPLLEVLDRKHL